MLLCFSSRAPHDEEQIWIFKAFSLEVYTAVIDMLTLVVNFSVQVKKKVEKSIMETERRRNMCVSRVCVPSSYTSPASSSVIILRKTSAGAHLQAEGHFKVT